jgi:hypothetical protein
MKVVQFAKQPKHYLGQSIKVFLKLGGAFYLKVTAAGPDYFEGYDEEGLNLHVDVNDIDFILG